MHGFSYKKSAGRTLRHNYLNDLIFHELNKFISNQKQKLGQLLSCEQHLKRTDITKSHHYNLNNNK